MFVRRSARNLDTLTVRNDLVDKFQYVNILRLLVKPGTPEQRNAGTRNSGTPEQHYSGTRNTGTLKIFNLLKIRKKSPGGVKLLE